MRQQVIKKRLLKESAIFAAAVLLLAGSLWYLDGVVDDYQKESQATEAKVNAINIETSTLREKYSKVQRNAVLYQQALKKNADGNLTVNGRLVSDKFREFRNQYYLNNLRLTAAGIEEMKEEKYKRKSSVIVSTQIDVGFDALSDEDAYDLIAAMQQDLPGSSKVVKLTLSRREKGHITNEILRAISERGNYPMVHGEMRFLWFGIKPVETANGGANAPKTAP